MVRYINGVISNTGLHLTCLVLKKIHLAGTWPEMLHVIYVVRMTMVLSKTKCTSESELDDPGWFRQWASSLLTTSKHGSHAALV